MRVNKTLLMVPFIVFSAGASAVTQSESEPIELAFELETDYRLADNATKTEVLEAFEALARANPDDASVISRYVNLLISRGEYRQAIGFLEPVNKVDPTSSLLLKECMLKDRVGEKEAGCYQRVPGVTHGEPGNHLDYLMALYFSDEAKFNAEKQRLQKLHPELESDFALFEQDRLNILLSLYP